MTAPIAPTDLLFLLAAVASAALGGSSFLRGVLGIAAWLRLPKLLVATTVAAFATSSPELTVSMLAALSGKPGIGLGDALGSNMVNLGLILGIALLFRALPAQLGEFRRDFVLALVVPALTLILALDGTLSRADGAGLLALFAGWLTLVSRQAMALRRDRAAEPRPTVHPMRVLAFLLGGLAGLILAGRLFVIGASGIAEAMGVHPFVIGATVVAIGTSLPEWVTMLLSRLRGHDDIGLGTLLGSNLFNGLAIVGVTAMIQPIHPPRDELATVLGLGAVTVLMILPHAGTLSRRRGLALLAAYGVFVGVTVAL